MKTTFVIVLVLLVLGLVAGIVVPHEQPAAASLGVSAEQASAQSGTEPPPNRIAYNRARGAPALAADDAASSATTAPSVLAPQPGITVPIADALGVAGLLGAAIVTVVLLQGGRPHAASHAQPRGGETPRQQS